MPHFGLGHKAKCELRRGEVILREKETELRLEAESEPRPARRPAVLLPLHAPPGCFPVSEVA